MITRSVEAGTVLSASARLWRASILQQAAFVAALALAIFLLGWWPSPLYMHGSIYRNAFVNGIHLLADYLFPAIQAFYLHAMIRAAVPAPSRWTLRGALPALAAIGSSLIVWTSLDTFLFLASATHPIAGLALAFGDQTLIALGLTLLGPWVVRLADPSLVARSRSTWWRLWRLWVVVTLGLQVGGWVEIWLSIALSQINTETVVPDYLWLLAHTLSSYIACQVYLVGAVILVRGFRTVQPVA